MQREHDRKEKKGGKTGREGDEAVDENDDAESKAGENREKKQEGQEKQESDYRREISAKSELILCSSENRKAQCASTSLMPAFISMAHCSLLGLCSVCMCARACVYMCASVHVFWLPSVLSHSSSLSVIDFLRSGSLSITTKTTKYIRANTQTHAHTDTHVHALTCALSGLVFSQAGRQKAASI